MKKTARYMTSSQAIQFAREKFMKLHGVEPVEELSISEVETSYEEVRCQYVISGSIKQSNFLYTERDAIKNCKLNNKWINKQLNQNAA
ncbi:hypothetical protein [Kingella negevensis]|uniref:Uncharacterized protein n=1 Tax=Kingella negevensis TaxID=1522312 RepID=A0A238HJ95_9NEIS|nr:hypothetical protein [Kingella negevensis]MDK4679461.1 hypothetical protein [Kingella negevensis]MDK4682821.1 hypothetical protein [Kingella negevensis]MDK4684961.1 hypothetical protein [Kingella negevensis]MDK4689361.1 hypothetical protein [Kingella negevensis]MDK4691018.1 hypothetical protein [Kingella negevensis]